MSTHTITAEIDCGEEGYPVLEIDYTFTKGSPASVNDIDGGDPGWGAEVDLVAAKVINSDGMALAADQVKAMAEKWLGGVGYDRACDNAEERADVC